MHTDSDCVKQVAGNHACWIDPVFMGVVLVHIVSIKHGARHKFRMHHIYWQSLLGDRLRVCNAVNHEGYIRVKVENSTV